jgi:hypothetical protein
MSDLYHYEYEQDEFYCYLKSHTLKNKLNIIDEEIKIYSHKQRISLCLWLFITIITNISYFKSKNI